MSEIVVDSGCADDGHCDNNYLFLVFARHALLETVAAAHERSGNKPTIVSRKHERLLG